MRDSNPVRQNMRRVPGPLTRFSFKGKKEGDEPQPGKLRKRAGRVVWWKSRKERLS